MSNTVSSLPLHTFELHPHTKLNRVFAAIYSCALIALFYQHIQSLLHCTPTTSVFLHLSLLLADAIFAFMWVTTQAFRMRPIKRKTHPENLPSFLDYKDYPGLDVFICTADPYKEPPINVVNTALSVMAYDYPTNKVSVYVSDDGGSVMTLFAFMEAAKFAAHWLPFCREKNIVERSPEAYFGSTEVHNWGTEIDKIKVSDSGIVKAVWTPPEYGDAVACICIDGSLSLWEEVEEDAQSIKWILCKHFDSNEPKVLDLQFGICSTSLKMVAAYSNGLVKVYELTDPLDLKKWQLQAEFQNVIDSVPTLGKPSCVSASISWNPQRGESNQSSFTLGFNSELSQFNSSKVWEFDEAHQRWLPVAELSLPADKGDPVYAVAWAPNIGRPYEILAVATGKGIAIWHIGRIPDNDGKLLVEKVALLSGHEGEVWQMEWDMGGMTLASTGSDGLVRLWQSDLNGVWHEQATLETAPS